MITGMLLPVLPSASGSNGNARFSRNWMVLSSGAESSSVTAISACPKLSRLPQRCRLATQSRASTGVPSWNFNPSRNVSRHTLPSLSVTAPCTICGCARNCASEPYSVSNTMNPWLRVT